LAPLFGSSFTIIEYADQAIFTLKARNLLDSGSWILTKFALPFWKRYVYLHTTEQALCYFKEAVANRHLLKKDGPEVLALSIRIAIRQLLT
ncbi:MAG TPA: hypothetical protein VLD57_12965, partial [Blastocatellia bacterium]|nr:hypothetical protein [Blastocatellia bacterium]